MQFFIKAKCTERNRLIILVKLLVFENYMRSPQAHTHTHTHKTNVQISTLAIIYQTDLLSHLALLRFQEFIAFLKFIANSI